MQLNKYLAHAGVASRRQAAELVKSGKVMVNSQVTKEPGYQVKPTDMVQCQGAMIRPEEKVYILLNKPKGYITTVADERNRKTVMQLIESANLQERIYPVGRLDRDTTGALILTNDGDFAQQLSHPRYEVQKVYHVTVNDVLRSSTLHKIAEGLVLEDGKIEVDEISYIPENPRNRVRLRIHSGKNRIVRRIFEHLGYEVVKLDRINYAGLILKGLPRGAWRYLTKHEVALFKR